MPAGIVIQGKKGGTIPIPKEVKDLCERNHLQTNRVYRQCRQAHVVISSMQSCV